MDKIAIWKSHIPKVEKAIEPIKDKDDVRQEAQLGIWLAIITYDSNKGDLETWITIKMWSAIKNYFEKERRIYERIRYDGNNQDI